MFLSKSLVLTLASCLFFGSLASAQTAPEIMPDMRSAEIIYIGIGAHDREHYDSALAMFDWIHPNDSNFSWAVAEKANTLLALERYEQVVEVCENALAKPSGYRGSLYMSLGTAYDELEQSDKALDAYERGINESPMSERLYFNKAITHIRRDEWQASFESLKRAVSINPYYASGHYVIGLLAREQGDYAVATLATSAFLMLENKSSRALSALADLNKAVSEKLEITDHQIDFGEDFSKLNLVIKNYVALRESYQTPSDFGLPVIKQAHLVFSQLKGNQTGWISNFYGEFFKAVVADDKLFEGFSNLIMMPSTNESHQKLVERNMPKINKFVEWANPSWNNMHSYVRDTLNGQELELRYLRDANHNVEAVGQWDKKGDRPVGMLRFFDANGTHTAIGAFDKSGERTGTWKWFYDTGLLREVQTYEKGLANGIGKFYDNNGYLAISQEWKDDEREGERLTYYVTGSIMNRSFYKGGKMEGAYTSYHPQGGVDYTVQVVDGQQDGEAIAYYATGGTRSVTMFKAGQREGKYTSWYPNGQISEESNYSNDESNGRFAAYYPTGKLKREGQYVNGMRSGLWKTYYADGTLDYTEEYDEEGKQTGVYTDYDLDGTVVNELEYKKGDVVAYRYYDLSGNLISEQNARKGKLDFKAYHYNRLVSSEGVILDGEKDGTWNYYNDYGVIRSRETYVLGSQEDIDYEYFVDGKLETMTPYKNGTLNGVYLEFYADSSMYCQGRYVNGQQEGAWYYYNPDGTQRAVVHYVAGKLDGEQRYYSNTGKIQRVNLIREGLLMAYEFYSPEGERISGGTLENGTGSITWHFPNGQLAYEAEVVKGEYHGPVKSYYPNGEIKMEGLYQYDNAEGVWNWYHLNGTIQTTGRYENDEREGRWLWQYANGKRETLEQYVLGKTTGERKEYSREGNLISTSMYLNGQQHGERYLFGEDSIVAMKRVFRYGTVISYAHLDKTGQMLPETPIEAGNATIKCMYPNGKTALSFTYKNGYFQGVYNRYYTTGKPMRTGEIDGGRDQGLQVYYYTSGQKDLEENTYMDQKHGLVTMYHPNGKVYRTENYVYGKREGEAKEFDSDGKQLHTEYWFNGELYSIE